ncbi:MAG: AAA family ATPase [Polyangia bacterium]
MRRRPDRKPSNVFLRDGRQPVLVDFGLVLAYIGADGREILQVDSSLAGTVAYMAPEQLSGELVDARADLFALGCMLYEGLTGKLPFPGSFEARARCGFSPPPRPSLIAPAVAPWLDDLVLHMLAADRRARLGHASDVAAVLARSGTTAPAAPEATSLPSRTYLYRAGFTGRSELLADLKQRVRRLHLGKGELVLISGESGSGKTRLISELLRGAATAQLTVIASECPPVEVTAGSAPAIHRGPLVPLRPLLQAVADLCRTDWPLRLQGLQPRHLAVLAAFEPALADLPGVASLTEAPLGVDAVKHRVLTAAAETLVVLAKRAPVLLLLDDLQWADDLTLDLLGYLAGEVVGRAPVMIVGGFRSEETSEALAALAARPGVHQVTLGRLDEGAVGSLVSDMLALPQPPPELVGFVSEHAQGNPFFISEYLHNIAEEGLLQRGRRGSWELAAAPGGPDAQPWHVRLTRLELPRTLRAIVERRLRRLEAPLGDVVAVAALLGREFDAELLGELAGDLGPQPERALADALNEVLRRQILETAGGGRYRFTHDKLREAAYESLGKERLRTLHRAAAEALERRGVKPGDLAELANHFSKAEVPDKAVYYLRAASEQALAAGAHQQAVPLLARALDHAASPGCSATTAERAWLHKLYSDALFGIGDVDGSVTHAEAALLAMGAPVPKTTGRWVLLLLRQLVEQIARILPEPRPTAPLPDEAQRLELALAAGRLSSSYFSCHRPQLQVMTATFLAANLADRAGPRGPRALPYSILGCTAGFFRLERLSALYFARARQDARARGDRAVEASIAIPECALHQGMTRWDEVRRCSDAGMATALQVGDRMAWQAVGLLRGGTELLTGELEAGARLLRAIRHEAEGLGQRLTHGWSSTLLSIYELWQGRPQAARELALSARKDLALDRDASVACALAVAAAASRVLGEREPAAALSLEGVAVLERGQVMFQLWPACALLTWTLLELWEEAAARGAYVSPELRRAALAACRIARSLGRICPIGAPFAARAAGVAARVQSPEKPARACALLEEAVAIAQRLRMPVAHIEACIELGRTVPDATRRRALLERARAEATALGCGLLAERAAALLAPSPPRPDSPVKTT